MPLFSDKTPVSKYYNDPEYVTDPKKKMGLAVLGFKPNGEHNTFGNIMKFLNPFTAGTDFGARRLAKGTDAFDNVKQEQKNDVGIGANTLSGIGRLIAGDYLGGAGQLAGTIAGNIGKDVVDFTDDGQVAYYASGGKITPPLLRIRTVYGSKKQEPFVPMKKIPGEKSPVDILKDFGDEDILMIDKQTQQPVGEISYGEGVFDEPAYKMMKKLAGDPMKLGKFVQQELKTHDKTTKMDGGGEMPGGDGKKPVVVTDPNDKRLQAYNDSTYLYNRSRQILRDIEKKDTTINPDLLSRFGGNIVKMFSPSDIFQRLGAVEPVSVQKVMVPKTQDVIDVPIYKKPTQPVVLQSKNDGGEIKKYWGGGGVTGNPVEEYFLNLLRDGDMTALPTPDIEGLPTMEQPILQQRAAPSPEAPMTGTGFKMGADGAGAGGIDFENIFNVAKSVIGMAGANDKIPEYQRPDAWTDYLAEVTARRDRGLSPQDITAARNDINNQYISDYTNIKENAGGSAATLLGNLGAAGARRTDARLRLAGLNSAAARDNYNTYSDAVFKELGLDRQIFNEKRDLAIENKNAASALAAEGMQGIIDSRQYNKTYGEGSPYFKYMQYLTDNEAELSKLLGSDVMKMFLKSITPGNG